MNGFSLWLLIAAATIAAGVIVPYGLLVGTSSSAVFVFWCAFGVAVIARIVAGTSRWRD